ncbi:MAG: hypothetical protein IKU52_08440 [Clostridia bacterium]|nr:hypothetical protein [Clostridia bacterium]
MRSKRIVLVSAIILCVACVVGYTVAYFTAEDKARNVITAGSLNIEVIEQQKNEVGELTDYPEEPIQVLPGANVSKIVTVKNLDADAFIRVKYNISVKDKDGNAIDFGDLVKVTSTNSDWVTDSDDGWLYYKAIVKSGEITLPVIENVEFSTQMGNEYQGATAEIDIIAQAVQAANNGEDVLKAEGWPEEK